MKESAGKKLKDLRLAKGLSLEDVHKGTKIHLDVLKALEEDSLINFNPVYIKGFLKIYCKFLGVEPRELIPEYKEHKANVKYVPGLHDGPFPSLKTFSLKSIPFKAISVKLKAAIPVILIALFIFGLFSLGRFISSRPRRISKSSASTAAVSHKSEPGPVANKAQKAPVVKMITLDIHAKDNCFIHVKADGRVIFQNILKRGRSESWQAKDKIELSLGNAGVVELEVNGKRIPSLGRKGQSVKNIVITKEGLNIKR
ncbi:MAG: RodZ domain-containing protein [Candidatus Omnitrophota bacterium]|jgi:hypothetical protein